MKSPLKLPRLPEGHFWRITSDAIGPLVQIRRDRRIGSALILECYAFPGQAPSAGEAVRRAAQKLFHALAERAEERRELDQMAELRGDYR
ncbi:hypothetical protein [Streptomyces sp. NPDC051014]|uniref:hypothetical protein n=1 Tax=Streptomyces sp. NPDC051014 TaxID=3155751 RepID=UPI0033E5CBFF